MSPTELSVTSHTAGEKTSFEFAEYIVISGNTKVKVAITFRTPYSEKHPVTVSTFLGEFAEYLESIVLSSERLIRDLTQQDGWKTQDGKMVKKCHARPGMHNLAQHFFVIHPS